MTGCYEMASGGGFRIYLLWLHYFGTILFAILLALRLLFDKKILVAIVVWL
jgi:hypothetical protein